MRARLRNLYDERAAAWSKVQDIQDRRSRDGYEPTQEDGETYTRALDDVEKLGREIEEEERADRLGATFDRVEPGSRSTNPRPAEEEERDVSDEYREAFGSYLRRGDVGMTPEGRSLLEQGFVALEDRAQAAGVDAAGGYTVPKEFLHRMTEALKAFGGILSIAEVLNTTTGAPLQWPTNDDTGNVGAILAENTQVTEQDTTFGSVNLAAHMYTSKMVRVSRQLLQDTAFDLEVWLPRKLGERIGRAAAGHFGTGTGTAEPQGLVTGLTKVQETGTASKIGYDDLVDLEHMIDPAYRQSPSVRYVLHDLALRDMRKIKDTQGRPLWVPAIAGGPPSTINGYAYTIDNSLPAPGAEDAKPIVFGDIRAAYAVRVVNGAQTLRLSERYADYLQIGFLGFQRLDGKVQDASAAAALQIKSA
ncbi:phage major capsid protein [Cellulosimicrobium funkei]|uniref:phage major capsid protein n=1 Tax=Cellulosimicrobium funkei TaxID=264251 RepID=UPI0036678F7C